MKLVVGIIGPRGAHQNTLTAGSEEDVIADGHTLGMPGFIPALRVAGDVDARHVHGVKQVVLNAYRLARGDQDAACGDAGKAAAGDLHLRGVGHILNNILRIAGKSSHGFIQDNGHGILSPAVVRYRSNGARGILQRHHSALGGKVHCVAHIELWEACRFVVSVFHGERFAVRTDALHCEKSAVDIDGIVVRSGEVTVLDRDLPAHRGHLHKISKTRRGTAGLGAGAERHVFQRDVLR